MPLELLAPAKINLGLAVRGFRPDGYHEIETVFQTIDLSDRLRLSPARSSTGSLTLTVDGKEMPGHQLPGDDENLVLQAARRLRRRARRQQAHDRRLTARIQLEKRIPVAAGLGGGSADAAAVLRGLSRFWGLKCSPAALYELARDLGADVPFCLTGGTALGRGRGDRITVLPELPPLAVVTVTPKTPVETAEIYQLYRRRAALSPVSERRSLRTDTRELVDAVERGDTPSVGRRMFNDLTGVVSERHPEVKKVQDFCHRWRSETGAVPLGVSMSGSGSTVFALMPSAEAGRRLAEALERRFAGAYIHRTQLRGARQVRCGGG